MSSIVSSAAAASNLAGGEDTIPLITNDQQRFDVPKKIAFNIKVTYKIKDCNMPYLLKFSQV